MSNYAIKNKVKLFRLFDEGKRPADIANARVKRTTLYQYYGEWRRKRGIKGRQVGFATCKFNRKAYLEAKEKARQQEEKERINRLVLDWQALIEAWSKQISGGKVYLPGSLKYVWPQQRLLLRSDEKGRNVLTVDENLVLFKKWVKIGKKAQDRDDFIRLCREEGIGLPPTI